MFTRTADVTDDVIVTTLRDGWGIEPDHVEYVAVGFGSHHWRAASADAGWFINVDDLEARRRDDADTRAGAGDRLAAALAAATAVRDADLDFVVAPIRTRAGELLQPVGNRYVAAVYPHVVGTAHPWGPYPNRAARLAVLDRIAALHCAAVPAVARHDDFVIPRRDGLVAVFASERPWGPGPYAEAAQNLLRQRAEATERMLTWYDELARVVDSVRDRWVLTHGEPHRGNTIDTATGVMLIDWDTALVAPPERDLWTLIDEDPLVTADYTERTGAAVGHTAVELYRLGWDLTEIALFVADFRAPHDDTEDTRIAWAKLQECLAPDRWPDCE